MADACLEAVQCPAVGAGSLFITDAAQILGVSKRTVYYRIQQGRLQTVRTPCGSQRVLLSSIEELLRVEGRGAPATGGRHVALAAGASPIGRRG